jgi:hypothetical protein
MTSALHGYVHAFLGTSRIRLVPSTYEGETCLEQKLDKNYIYIS